MPSYGPEMRGGTANCIVILSPTRVSSPIVTRFDAGIVLNQPSLDKFESRIKEQGLLLYEESTIIHKPTRSDLEILVIPAAQEALKLGKRQVANMVMVGAFLARRPMVSLKTVLEALRYTLPERHHHLLPLNERALQRGETLARRMDYVPS